MQTSVLKFGGSSLATPDKLKNVAQIVQMHAENSPTIVVLSAMYGETNRLMQLAQAVANNPAGKDLDFLLTTGEQVSVALLSLCLNNQGIPAVALDAHKIKLKGRGKHQNALVKSLDCSIIKEYLQQGIIPIITGFQVVMPCGSIATMERGGSDTSAVALAAAFSANCYIYSDVDGVYSADPNEIKTAQHLPEISYQDMLALSAVGAKVLQVRSIQLAEKYKVSLFLRSTFSNIKQTIVKDLESKVSRFFGVAITKNRYMVSINGRIDKISDLDIKFDELTGLGECHDAIIEPQYLPVLKAIFADNIKASGLLSRVSLVGLGSQSKATILSKVLSQLAVQGYSCHSYRLNDTSIDFWVAAESASSIANKIHEISASDITA